MQRDKVLQMWFFKAAFESNKHFRTEKYLPNLDTDFQAFQDANRSLFLRDFTRKI